MVDGFGVHGGSGHGQGVIQVMGLGGVSEKRMGCYGRRLSWGAISPILAKRAGMPRFQLKKWPFRDQTPSNRVGLRTFLTIRRRWLRTVAF